MTNQMQVAILYQAHEPPCIHGIHKPMKKGGYSDSGADIAYALKLSQISVVTPILNPDQYLDTDWVFPDTEQGINEAIEKGANILWLNTVLYKDHPIVKYLHKINLVGQIPENVEKYDDKYQTNNLLKLNNLPIPNSILISSNDMNYSTLKELNFPIVIKPIKGRGSQGVTKVNNFEELLINLKLIFDKKIYGTSVYLEEYLSGNELTITVMPPGNYSFKNEIKTFSDYWCLPPVKRFSHENGIAPYNGTVAVVNNSKVLNNEDRSNKSIQQLMSRCEKAAILVQAKAPIRIDCRANDEGNYYLFDLNMKPNMTGASRPHRSDQNSLSALAAREIGWSYSDLLINMLRQYWRL